MTNPYEPPSAGEAPVPAPTGWGAAPQATWGTAVEPGGWAPVAAPGQVVPTSALASPWLRLGAALLNVVLAIVTLGIGYLVWTLVLWNSGTNPGKKICGLRVVKAETGQTCTFGDMLVRNFVFGSLVIGIASSVTIGIAGLVDIFMIFGERRQRLIDRMAGTLVVVG